MGQTLVQWTGGGRGTDDSPVHRGTVGGRTIVQCTGGGRGTDDSPVHRGTVGGRTVGGRTMDYVQVSLQKRLWTLSWIMYKSPFKKDYGLTLMDYVQVSIQKRLRTHSHGCN